MRIVIDTNVLLVSISSRSPFHWIYQSILAQKFQIAYTNEILTEYEEQISRHWNTKAAISVIRSLLELPNALPTIIYYRLNLISDQDDNKFVDCAFAANADYIVTEHKDYHALKSIQFPVIKVIGVERFKEILIERNLL